MKWYSVILMIFILGVAACTPQSETPVETPAEPIKLGFMGPLTGDVATYGQSIQRGVELALQESDANVELIVADSRCDGKEAVSAITKLITVDGVEAIVGEVCSSATLAAAPIANQNDVVLISPSSTSPQLSEAGEYMFRTVPSDALQGDFAGDLIYESGLTKLAILYTNEDYGLGLKGTLEAKFVSLGGEVVGAEAFERGTTDVRTQLTKIKEAEPDALYIVSNSPDASVSVLKQIAELGVEAEVFGSEGLKGPDITEGAGAAAEGLTVSSVSSGSAAFAAKHQEEYGTEPGPFAAQGYDAMRALLKAVEDGATTGSEIRTALISMEFLGATGSIAFDGSGDVSGNFDVFTVVDGSFQAEATE